MTPNFPAIDIGVSPRRTVYISSPLSRAGRVILSRSPANILLGSTILFSRAIASTVVPYSLAIAQSVSPARTYTVSVRVRARTVVRFSPSMRPESERNIPSVKMLRSTLP